jgi:hypothetical protein
MTLRIYSHYLPNDAAEDAILSSLDALMSTPATAIV